jgi:hypothetical protein
MTLQGLSVAFSTITDEPDNQQVVYFGSCRQGLFSSNLICTSGLFHTSMFYIIGLGLCDEKDITLRGLEVRTFPC